MTLLDVLAPCILRPKSEGSVSFKAYVGHRVEAGDLSAAIAPQTLTSVAQSLLVVDFIDVLLQGLEVMQLRLAVLPLALE